MIEQLRNALQGLESGNIEIVVQDGVVVQLQRSERMTPARKKKNS
ncbi:YezD family protein [Anatilimnocola floriformis]|nr:YezD family protein [Anatilimnocola floriformis]